MSDDTVRREKTIQHLQMCFTVEPSDYTDFSALAHQRWKPVASKKLKTFRIVICVLILFDIGVLLYGGAIGWAAALAAALVLLLCARCFRDRFLLMILRKKTAVIFKDYPARPDSFCGRKMLTIDGHSIFFHSIQEETEGCQSYALTSCTGVSENTRCFVIWLGQVYGIVIPKRDMTAAEIDCLKSTLRDYQVSPLAKA